MSLPPEEKIIGALGAIALIAIVAIVLSGMALAYVSNYNRAMVDCLAEHTKDVCVETLR